MDESSHVFLIKDKIRCIQKKIMDQLAADLNSALNDANILTSSLSNVPITSSATTSKIKRRRKRPINNDMQQHKIEASDSTTPENSQSRNKQSIVSDSDDMPMPSKTQSSSLATASESDSALQADEIRRRRRPFKKPIIPPTSTSILKTEQSIQLTRCPSVKISHTATISTPLRRRRRNCRSESSSRILDIDRNTTTPSSSSAAAFSLAMNHSNYIGKRKRSRTIVQDDFRIRNNSLHDYDMTCIDDPNLTNFSSSSSLNLSDSDKDPCLTSNEADDEQSDWPRDESSIPRVISWWEDNDDDKSENDDDDNNNDEKMLTTTDGTLQKIVNGALSMMLTNSKNTIQNRIKSYVDREMLTGNRRNLGMKNAYTHPHLKRHIRLLKESRRSHHNSYNHKRVKSDHHKHNEIIAPIDATNIGHQLLEKIGWTPGNGLGVNQNGITAPVQIDYRNYRQGLGYENTSIDITERMESEQSSSLTSHPPPPPPPPPHV
ncbi:unnamed protein product [Adineta steineri]|uniref:G-patch domain-containing protein n=1 Tax=Adineta steineri TaxID=433720 RepID=A0A819GVF2_9BILA|nr:unnamed protein product [Adineta steineri]CAF3890033.1 unnamed protein product [Adineta steineri]